MSKKAPARMDYSSSGIEEIQRKDLAPPQIRLKIISLNLNDKGQTVAPPPQPPTQSQSNGSLVPYIRKPLVLKKTQKLRSFEHMLQAIEGKQRASSPAGRDRKVPSDVPNGNISCNGHCARQETFDKESQTDHTPDNNDQSDDDDPTYVIFIRGMNKAFTANQQEIVNTVVNLLNKHVISVSAKEHKLFAKSRKRPSADCVNHIVLKGALMAINELVDDGVLEVTPNGLILLTQGLTFTICLHRTLAQFAKDIWNSRHAEFIRDAWMSFGGLAAVLVMSATRQ
ncbi:uncharacterized protein [Macrobrachium rosenbergii]|uniref:uncharacterized protein n=1 Tax=Macrobrachium rosenbergii TaxID=79674 RepID=UPI0034D798AA